MRRCLLALLCLLVLAPAAHARPVVGFADQNAGMFTDARFLALGVHDARLNLPWDVLQDPNTLPGVDAWMAGARRANVRPLVTIDRSRRAGQQSRNPSAGTIATQLRAWRRRWPGQVRQVSSWNEGNVNKRPELVAQWYRAILRACPGCTVIGADIVDRSNATSWAQRFVRAAGRSPKVWGLHNYIDANTFTTRNTTRFLQGVKGEVWLTETGGVLRRSRPVARFSGTGAAHAANATRFVLARLVPLDRRRIKRVYLYSWATGPGDVNWDSGIIGPDGTARPALRLVQTYLGRPVG